MYESFFGLNREPFSVAPDPRFLYMSDKHREALEHLMHGLRSGGGFVLLTGEIGAGKTTVWRTFLEQLPSNFDVAYVVNPKLGVAALMARVCDDLHVEQTGDVALRDPIDAIHGHLLLAHAEGRRTLIVVDEAQALSLEVLEQLRLLTNLVTSDRKLVQVLLIGQPELRTLIERPELEPLAQRVVARYHLHALTAAETALYVAHRLGVAGLQGPVPFDAAALARVHKLCGGVPRRINVLCDRAMLKAFAQNSRVVTERIVEQTAGEVFGRMPPPPMRAKVSLSAWWVVAGAAGLALALGLLLAPWLTPILKPSRSSVASAGSPHIVADAPVVSEASVPPAPSPSGSPASTSPAATSFSPASPSAAAIAPARAPAPAPPAASVPARQAAANLPPATGPSPVPAVAPTAPPALPPDLELAFNGAAAEEPQAWRMLGALWGAKLGGGDPCNAAPEQSLYCFRTHGGLGPIRQLGRPGILKLSDDHGRVANVMLMGLGDDTATLRINGADRTVPLLQLARVWRGDFATLWRAPAGYREGQIVGVAGPVSAWLGQRLALIDSAGPSTGDEALKSRVFAFQLAHGLEPDGLTGPLTMMQLNRASGVDEPKLGPSR